MHLAEAIQVPKRAAVRPKHLRSRGTLPALDQVKLPGLRVDQVRAAVQENLVSFPGQIPTFERHERPDLQRRIVQLYFLFGWSCETIAARYGMLRQRVGQVLATWKKRAFETGCIQCIPPAENLRIPTRIKIVLSPVVKGCVGNAARRKESRPIAS